MDFHRFSERACLMALGYFIGTRAEPLDIPIHLVPIYAAIAVAIVIARRIVVSRRNKRDNDPFAASLR
jgi:membrane protein DedA with SNARE-associated domain